MNDSPRPLPEAPGAPSRPRRTTAATAALAAIVRQRSGAQQLSRSPSG